MRIGKVTDSVLKRSVQKLIKSTSKLNPENHSMKGAVEKRDCALSIDEDGFGVTGQVSTFTAKAGREGYYAVHNAANNLYASGVEPSMIILNVMLSPDTEEEKLKNIMRDCKEAADELGIRIGGGHTEVTDALLRPLISAAAVGSVRIDANIAGSAPKTVTSDVTYNTATGKIPEGSSIVMTKWAALEGTAILASERRDELCDRFPAPMVREASSFSRYISVREDANIAYRFGVGAVHDISGGGVFAALWELSEIAGCGFEIDLKAIPLRQETIEITNFLGLNPYQMISGGSLLFITENPEKILGEYEKAGIPAAVIGRTTGNNDKLIINDDERRYLDKPAADEILKL